MKDKFGPENSKKFDDPEEWREAALKKGLHFVGCTSGIIAQDSNETGHGAWFFKSKRGWLED